MHCLVGQQYRCMSRFFPSPERSMTSRRVPSCTDLPVIIPKEVLWGNRVNAFEHITTLHLDIRISLGSRCESLATRFIITAQANESHGISVVTWIASYTFAIWGISKGDLDLFLTGCWQITTNHLDFPSIACICVPTRRVDIIGGWASKDGNNIHHHYSDSQWKWRWVGRIWTHVRSERVGKTQAWFHHVEPSGDRWKVRLHKKCGDNTQ
jgi:hypothetical protein